MTRCIPVKLYWCGKVHTCSRCTGGVQGVARCISISARCNGVARCGKVHASARCTGVARGIISAKCTYMARCIPVKVTSVARSIPV